MFDFIITLGFCLLFATAGFVAGWNFKGLRVEMHEYKDDAARENNDV